MKSEELLYDCFQMDVDILEIINQSALGFMQLLTPEATYKAIIDEALKLVEGDEGYIALKADSKLQIVYARPKTLMGIKIRKKGFSYVAYSQKRAFVTFPEKYKEVHPELIEMGIQSTIFIPLFNGRESIGVINIMLKKRSRIFTPKELSILRLFGALASMAIRKTQLYSETKSALETRDLFISMAAHEFRTPLTTIGGYAQLLKLKIKKESAEKRWVEEIYKEAQRLSRLVNELLVLNHIKTGRLQYFWKECNLYALTNEVIELFKVANPERKINFETNVLETDSFVVGDDDKITQVLINILDNAAKFSPKDKYIDISLKGDNEDLIIQIKDYGEGVDKKDQNKIFEGFYRGSNNAKEGMGLGLYLAKRIIERHKGKIRLKSKLNQGSIVEIKLPRILVQEE